MTEVEPGVEIDEEVFEPGESHGTVIRLSLTAALGGFLFGYDSSVINGAVAAITAHFSASAAVLGFTVSSALLGAAAGALGAGNPDRRCVELDDEGPAVSFSIGNAAVRPPICWGRSRSDMMWRNRRGL